MGLVLKIIERFLFFGTLIIHEKRYPNERFIQWQEYVLFVLKNPMSQIWSVMPITASNDGYTPMFRQYAIP